MASEYLQPERNTISAETAEWCQQNDIELFELTGRSLANIQDSGVIFWGNVPQGIQDVRSRSGIVGIDLDHMYLKGTNWPFAGVQSRIAFENYKRMVEDQSRTLTAIIGNVADYTEIAHQLFTTDEIKLFDGKFAKTSTLRSMGMKSTMRYEIGDETPEKVTLDYNNPNKNAYGFNLRTWYDSGRAENSFIFPLIVAK